MLVSAVQQRESAIRIQVLSENNSQFSRLLSLYSNSSSTRPHCCPLQLGLIFSGYLASGGWVQHFPLPNSQIIQANLWQLRTLEKLLFNFSSLSRSNQKQMGRGSSRLRGLAIYNQMWVHSPMSRKTNLLTPSRGEGKWSIYGRSQAGSPGS